MEKPYNRVYKIRGLLMLPPCLFTLFITFRATEWDSVLWPAGLAVFFAGVAIRTWAQVHLHYRLKTRKALTTTGPYAYVRNPIYIANTVMLLGLTVLSGLLWFLPVMLLWCAVVYTYVVKREEAHLIEKYGEPYRDFLRRVSRWLPRMNHGAVPTGNLKRFLLPSIVAELHCLLWLVPFVARELVFRAPF